MNGVTLHKLTRLLGRVALESTSYPDENVSGTEAVVATEFLSNSPTTISDVVRTTGVAQSQVSTIAKSMREKGLIAARADEHDGRKVLLHASSEAIESLSQRRNESSIHEALTDCLTRRDEAEVDPKAVLEAEKLLDRLAVILRVS